MRRAFVHGRSARRLRQALLVGALATVLSLSLAGSASGGAYDVYACYGGADNSWSQFADPGMAAYDLCPNNPSQLISGMVVRASVASATVGYLQGAYQVFSAPAGASLAEVSFTVSPYRWEGHWTVGFVAFDGDFNRGDLPYGCYAYQAGCGIVPGGFFGPERRSLGGHSQVRIEARCGNPSGCTLASTGTYPYTRATFSIANVVVRVQDFSQPGLGLVGGGLAGGGWLRGVQGIAFDASDNVGIRETRVRVDGQEIAARGKPCDYSLRVPCPQGGDHYTIDTATARPDGAHTLTAEAVDSAGNAGQLSRTVLIDNSPPAQPLEVTVDGGQEWRSRNDFRLAWRNPPPDGGAPIAGAAYELCPADGGACETVRRDGNELTRLDGIRVPRAGEYVVRVWLRDEAGNEDKKTAGQPVRLRLDDEAPELAFDGPDPSDPVRVAVRVSDRTSGIAGGEIELRRRGSQAWRPLDARLDGGHLVGHLPDETLPDGTYELRARAFDRAGNERSSDRRADGQRMEVTLPARTKTFLRARIAKSDRRGRSRVRFGRRARIAGRLTSAGRGPIAGASVVVLQMPRRDGATFTQLATVTSSRTGRFSYRAPAGTTRTLRFRHPGSPTIRPATRDVPLRVAASTTFGVSERFALNGETVTFSGRLRSGPVPAAGKIVELQARVRHHWRTFATSRTDAQGLWRYAYRFDGTRGRQVYTFRARVPREAEYPYEVGHSGRRRVTVVGL